MNFKIVLCLILMSVSTIVVADPPTRVIRLTDINGTVSFSPAGETDWIYATRNRPIITGDRLWNDENSQSVLQFNGATICVGANTSVGILNLNDSIAQFQFTQGIMILHVDGIKKDQTIEIDTPNLAFSVNQPGDFRIEVSPDGQNTKVSVRGGQGEAYGENNSYVIQQGQSYNFTGTDLKQFQSVAMPNPDDFDQWCGSHLAPPAQQATKQPVSTDVIGYQDLNRYGTWDTDEEYGDVWYPAQVAEDWAPYRDGDFVWIEPWGWSWVGDEPWGFAPYHYGRWFFRHRWCWIPGPYDAPAVYAPALVGFLAGAALADANGIGWFPLGPRDPYYPAYATSREYFQAVNYGNSRMNRKQIANAFDHPHQNVNYANLHVPNAITGVAKNTFVQGQPANKNLLKIPHEKINPANITNHANIAPQKNSLTGAQPRAKHAPNSAVLNRPIIAKSKVPPPTPAFSAKQEHLQQTPGKPLESSVMSGLEKAAPLIGSQIKNIVPRTPTTTPTGEAPKMQLQSHPNATEAPHPTQMQPKTIAAPKQRSKRQSQKQASSKSQKRQATPKTAEPKQVAPRRSQPRQEVAPGQEVAPRQEVPRAPASRRSQSRHEAPRQAAPQREAPRQAAPRHEAPRQAAPRQPAPRHEAPRHEAPRQAAPRQAAPRHEAPRQAAPRQAAPRHEAPRQAAPRQAAPRQAAPPSSKGNPHRTNYTPPVRE